MPPAIVATKLRMPAPGNARLPRPRLIALLDRGLRGPGGFARPLSLISAAAGYGKTTLARDWAAAAGCTVAWLSLDEGDADIVSFLACLGAALHAADAAIGAGAEALLFSPAPPRADAFLGALVNEVAAAGEPLLLVLDDFHRADSAPVSAALAFLAERAPPNLHLLVASREDPAIPLARARARGAVVELRAGELRFTAAEAAAFVERAAGLRLGAEDAAALEGRTEGWAAGLQLAALSLRGAADASAFIAGFSGRDRHVLDYLLSEVLERRDAGTRDFLLATSVLERLSGPLCDAVAPPAAGEPAGQERLEALERANLFIVPLDAERRWYRYHHLFAELLRLRLARERGRDAAAGSLKRAAAWHAAEGMPFEAFRCAAAAGDLDAAERIVEGGELPLHSRPVAGAVLEWLEGQGEAILRARPSLRIMSATTSLVLGRTEGVEAKLAVAEAALDGIVGGGRRRDAAGRIACARATLALSRYRFNDAADEGLRALGLLAADDRKFRASASWCRAVAMKFAGDRGAAEAGFRGALALGEAAGDSFSTVLALIGLGDALEAGNELGQAVEVLGRASAIFGDQPLSVGCELRLSLGRAAYRRNALDEAAVEGRLSLELARLYDVSMDRHVAAELFLRKVEIAAGEEDGAALAALGETVRGKGLGHFLPELSALEALAMIARGEPDEALRRALAAGHPPAVARARIELAFAGGPSARAEAEAALGALGPYLAMAEGRDLRDELLRGRVLRAAARGLLGDREAAFGELEASFPVAEREGIVRDYLDAGGALAALLEAYVAEKPGAAFARRLLDAFAVESARRSGEEAAGGDGGAWLLSEREREVLALVARGLSNREICDRLFIAMDTVKGHNRRIFEKLGAQRRTEAVARARDLGLL